VTAPRTGVRGTVVGIADMRISSDPAERLVTFALGSCLGIALFDPVARVGALAHVMMPSAGFDPQRADRSPLAFVDSGVPLLFREGYRAGAVKERMIVSVAGGATAADRQEEDRFQIGKRNVLMLRRLLWKNDVLIHAHDLGGVRMSRTMMLTIGTGEVRVRVNGSERRL
jgi:chemotaxis protein CheD